MVQIDHTWRLNEVVDTRARGTDFKPIGGTGDGRPCECCGRTIEVHASVVSRDGRSAIVGTQCCKKAGVGFVCYGTVAAATNKNYWKTHANH